MSHCLSLIKLEIDANHFLAASIDRSVCQLLHAKEAKILKVIMKYYHDEKDLRQAWVVIKNYLLRSK